MFGPRLRLALRLAQPRPRARILDVGIGTGLSISHYPASAYVVGVDLSRPMLQLAHSKVRRLHLTHLSLCQMDACRLAVADRSFDVVLSAFVASVVADRPAFFAELRRVCRADGTICIVNHVHFRSQPLAWLEQRLEPLTRRLGWHADLTLDDIVAGVGAGDLSVHSLWPADPWPVVLCRRRPV